MLVVQRKMRETLREVPRGSLERLLRLIFPLEDLVPAAEARQGQVDEKRVLGMHPRAGPVWALGAGRVA
jgi:hypothetical protein